VVETVLTGPDLHFFVFLFLRSDVDGVAQVGIEVIEVGHQTVEFDVLHFNTLVVQILFGVRGKTSLVPLEVQNDRLVELVESGVAERGFVVFQGGRSDMVLVQRLVGVSQKVASVDVEGSVVVPVGGVRVGLDQVSKNVDSVFAVQVDSLAVVGVDVAPVDGLTDSPLVILDVGVAVGVLVVTVPLSIVVEVFVQMGIVGPGWELQTVGVLQRWVVTSLEGYFVVEGLDFTETIGQTFQVVPGQDLLVDVVVLFATLVMFVVEILTTQPMGIVDVVVVVESIDANIFGEVRQRLFRVQVQVVTRIVSPDGVTIVVAMFLSTLVDLLSVVLLFVSVRLLDDFVVVEVVRIDFIDWRKDNSVSVRTVDDGNREGIQVHSLVDVLAGPNCSIVEGFEVFGVVEELVQSDSLLQVLFVED
jgi:hypothetical protein